MKYMHKLIHDIWEKEEMSEERKTAIITSLQRKGDKAMCLNYRGITLLNILYRIFSIAVSKTSNPIMEMVVGDYQTRFIKSRSRTEHIFGRERLEEVASLICFYVTCLRSYIA